MSKLKEKVNIGMFTMESYSEKKIDEPLQATT